MELAELHLEGFKSFADRTTFEFGRGMTAIVGPNGCGKSNIADAVKWILGEQSAKSLRGKEMTDVIFSGTSARPALNFAEGTLVFRDGNGVDGNPTEFSVTRRLYRSGESEYLIDGVTCRLKDIRERFMDTGIAADCYSVIEQGKVEYLLQSSPRERRLVFEEAAGISRYKAKKKESEAKLARVQENLGRIGDVLKEIQRQIRSVRYQARKAEKFKKLTAELAEKRLTAALHEYHHLNQDLKLTRERRMQVESALADLSGRISEVEKGVSELNSTLMNARDELRNVRSQINDIDAKSASLRESVRTNSEWLSTIEETDRKNQEEIKSTNSIISQIQGEIQNCITLQEKITREVESLRVCVQELQTRQDSLNSRIRRLSVIVEKKKERHFGAVSHLSRIRNEKATKLREQSLLENQVSKINARLAEIEKLFSSIESRRNQLIAHIEEYATEIRRLISRVHDEEVVASEKNSALESAIEQLSGKRETLAELEGRIDVLQGMLKQHQGLGQGARRVLEAVADPASTLHGACIRVLADLVKFAPEHAHVIESTLDLAAQYLVTDSILTALRAIKFLKENDAGRASFIPLELVKTIGGTPRAVVLSPTEGKQLSLFENHLEEKPLLPANCASEVYSSRHCKPADETSSRSAFCTCDLSNEPHIPVAVPAEGSMNCEPLDAHLSEDGACVSVEDLHGGDTRLPPGCIGNAMEIVTFEPEHETLLRIFLGNVFIYPDLDSLLTWIAKPTAGSSRRYVTLDGDVVDERGVISSGRIRETPGIIVQRGELQILEKKAALERKEIQLLEEKRQKLAAEATELEKAISELRMAVYQKSHEKLELEKALERCADEEQTLHKEKAVLEMEEKELRERIAGLEEEVARLDTMASSVSAYATAVNRFISSAGEALRIAKNESDGVAAELTERRVTLATLLQRRDGLTAERTSLERELSLHRARVAALNDSIITNVAKKRQLTEEISNARKLVEHLTDLRTGLETKCRELTLREAELDEKLRHHFEIYRKLEDERNQMRDVLERLRVEEYSTIAKMDALRERIRDEHAIDIDQRYTDGFQIAVGWDKERAENDIRDIREQMRSMGDVNMAALEELHELEKREKFYSEQYADLLRSQRSLEEIIRKLNKESRERFSETFEKARENFQKMFRKLFGGGKADIRLEENVDILEAGVEVVAMPPGKELRTLNLLSGGEKVLTTIALLFAIFQIKPSPFCLLDEVDAALDEANIDRFLALLNEFIPQTQFIVITHSKRTMASADVLYGITMEEPGVSSKVSVKLEEYKTTSN